MTDIEQIKREAIENDIKFLPNLSDCEHSHRSEAIAVAINCLHSRGYLGGVPDGYVLVPKEAVDIIESCIELNMSNYNEDQVCELNDAIIECAALIAAQKGETK